MVLSLNEARRLALNRESDRPPDAYFNWAIAVLSLAFSLVFALRLRRLR
ncbi:MAG: hypothetical protein AAFR31_01145 [Cyanobacteria bacterium J06627_8]